MSEKAISQIVLDLDRTTFETDRFTGDVKGVLHRDFDVSPADFTVDMRRHRHLNHGLSHYDFYGHMLDYGLDAQQVEDALRHGLAGNVYHYPDVPPFIAEAHARNIPADLLTHGEDRLQLLKRSFAPALGGLTMHIVLEPKGLYLAEYFTQEDTYVIDDMLIHNLPANVRQIRMDRDGKIRHKLTIRQLSEAWPIMVANAQRTAAG